MSRTTRVLDDRARFWQQFIALASAETLQTNALFGCHFRVFLDMNVVLDPPYEAKSGQRIVWCFVQDPTGSRTVTPNGFAALNGSPIPWIETTAGSASFVEAMYDDDLALWRLLPVLSKAYADALYDPLGAAAAAIVTAEAYTDTQIAAIPAGAPATAEYFVATLSGGLSAERVPTNTASITWDVSTSAQFKANVVFGTSNSTACVGDDARLHAQGLAVADAGGGVVIDAEARSAINSLLATLRSVGVIAT